MKGCTTSAMAKKPPVKKAQPVTAEMLTARRSATVLIGIDPGTKTGFALKHDGKFCVVDTFRVWRALNEVALWAADCRTYGKEIFVRIEDARLRTWFGNTGPEKWKGAGSIGRDCAIWVEVLTELQIPFELVHPKNVKETTSEYFKKLTGWTGKTSIHAREAAWLIL